jgi:hypothetical protein
MAKGRKTGGRKAGTPNRLTSTVKEAFETAFHAMQEQPGVKLGDWGKANPTEFYKLSARLIPAEIDAKISTHETAVELLRKGTGSA